MVAMVGWKMVTKISDFVIIWFLVIHIIYNKILIRAKREKHQWKSIYAYNIFRDAHVMCTGMHGDCTGNRKCHYASTAMRNMKNEVSGKENQRWMIAHNIACKFTEAA